MKTILILTALLGATLCFHVIIPEAVITTATADTTFANPNGSSELAVLMRDMQVYSNKAKADVKSGKSPAPYPTAFDKIHTARISEGMSKSEFYKSFADLYVMSVKNYATSTPAIRIETYNNMVSACLACHSQHCPGPVPAIKKLMIEPGK
ncbi:MAG: hypothetical protein M3Q95_11355 [Bacteroidota bacterium]|nr:hypothetical protein [Bacteroidota bacterium]